MRDHGTPHALGSNPDNPAKNPRKFPHRDRLPIRDFNHTAMKQLKPNNASAMIHSDPDTGLWGASEIKVGSTPTLDFRQVGSFLEKFGDDASLRGSHPFDSSSAAMKIIARVPRRLWVEFLLYTTAAIAIQILCIAIK